MNTEHKYNHFAKNHAIYERKALKMLLKEFRSIFKNIPYSNLTYDNAESVIALNINTKSLEKTMFQIYYLIGSDYGSYYYRKIIRENPREQKNFKKLPFFSQLFNDWLVNWFSDYGLENVKTIAQTSIDAVIREVRISQQNNESVAEMAKRIKATVNDPKFYKWQALRIARTETTMAINQAKELAVDESGIIMDKVWITRVDGKERDTHRSLNGTKVEQTEKFQVGDSLMKFPGDRENGSVTEVVNCRCTYGHVGRRDANGMLMFRD